MRLALGFVFSAVCALALAGDASPDVSCKGGACQPVEATSCAAEKSCSGRRTFSQRRADRVAGRCAAREARQEARSCAGSCAGTSCSGK